MRVVSWNMNKRRGNWDFLESDLQPDIALLQESTRITDTDKGVKKKVIEVTVKKHLRNTLYSPLPMKKVKMPNDSGMGLNVGSIEIDGFGVIYPISVYGNLDFWKIRMFDTHILGLLALYTKILRTQHDAEHIIIAGDFNTDPRMDDHKTYGRAAYKRWSIFFDNICDLGFSDCLKPTYPNQVQTYRHNSRSKFPWHLDHMFATEGLFNKLKRIEVIDNKKIRERSDHNPIVADFEITP